VFFRKTSFIALFLLFLSLPVLATTNRFSSFDYRPAMGLADYFSVEDSQTLFPGQFSLGVFNTYAYHPVRVINTAGTPVRETVEQYIINFATGSMGITRWWELGVDFPYISYNRFADPSVTTATALQTYQDLGDVRGTMKIRLLDSNRHRMGLALAPFATYPTGKAAHYMGENKMTYGGQLIADWKVRWFKMAINAGGESRERVVLGNVDFKDRVFAGIAAGAEVNDQITLFVEGKGSTPIKQPLKHKQVTPAEFGGGVRWNVKNSGFTVLAGGGSCAVCGVKGPQIRGNLGLSYRLYTEHYRELEQQAGMEQYALLHGPETPEMAIVVLARACPDDPAQFNSEIHDPGCPKYYDLKTISDLVIRCPDSPEKFDASKHDTSCSKVYDLSANFSEDEVSQIYTLSVQSLSENCPAEVSEFDPRYHDVSCPKYYNLQVVASTMDKCPKKAEGFDPKIHDLSCPKVMALKEQYGEEAWMILAKLNQKDSDSDQIPDYLDKCPNRAGTREFSGCLDTAEVSIKGIEIFTKKPIFFEFNNSSLSNEDGKTLGKMVDLLRDHPEIKHIEIHGHADDIGSKAANESTSLRRAKVVADYLRYRGLPESVELTVKGYGSKQPAISRKSFEARARNRRVVFVIR